MLKFAVRVAGKVAVSVAALLITQTQPWAATLPPAEHFVRPPALDVVVVSPSGKYLAAIVARPDGRQVLGVLSLDPLSDPRVVAGFSDADIEDARWVNDDRLVFKFVNRSASAAERRVVGMYAVDRDGKNLRELIAHVDVGELQTSGLSSRNRILPYEWDLYDTLQDGSPDVVVYKREYGPHGALKGAYLSRLDTLTGRVTSMSQGMKSQAMGFLLDGAGTVRAFKTGNAGRTAWYWREAANAPYVQVAEFETYGSEAWTPVALDERGRLLVLASPGRDTRALFVFDPRTKVLEREPMIEVRDFDLSPQPVFDGKTQRLLGLHLRAEAPMSYWFDQGMAQLQAGIDLALPVGRYNRLVCGTRCVETRYVVVHSSSDREPGAYLLFDRQALTLEPIAQSRPWIDESAQGARSFQRVPARDGLVLPVYLTTPLAAAKAAPLPTVVLVHEGPFRRGNDLGWSGPAAFLASRGYLVIEVDYRGSRGYGQRHFSAGWRQWGLAMQDDLADALAWAVREKRADPGRACIMGHGYGGYAALMGAVRHGDVYRCAVSFAGVTDIDRMHDINWSNFSDEWRHHGMPKLIGDQKTYAAQFEQTSPLRQVARIRIPLFMAHGLLDQSVPYDHFSKFVAAAKAARVPIETLVFDDQVHHFLSPNKHADYLRAVEGFLARSLVPR